MMSWPGASAPLLPVYGDLASAERAAHETGRGPHSYLIAGLTPRALFEWARQARFGIAIGVYPKSGQVRYLAIGATEL